MIKIIGLKRANDILPLLRSITKDIVAIWETIILDRVKFEGKVLTEEEKDLANAKVDKMNAYIKEVEDLGCYVKEFKRGVINIPTLIDGKPAFFCVQPAKEYCVNYWHNLDESYNNKKIITTKGSV